MTFILTNDDGIDAPGIRALQRAIAHASIAGESCIVAPNAHLSGCSHQLTTGRPIPLETRSPDEFAVGGTPADCARIALSYLCPEAEWVLSGINAGGNLGSDIYVSGTVAAVREAALLRKPGIAISHYIRRGRAIDWEVAIQLTVQVLDKLLHQPLEPGRFWNVNLPHLAPGDPAPEIVFCDCCTQPLPTDFEVEGNLYRYVGEYSNRARDPGKDVAVCFGGNIAVSLLRLW